MRLLTEEQHREAYAQDQSGENEQDIDPLDAPYLAVAVISGMGIDDWLAHGAIGMVGIPPALKSASAMRTARAMSNPPAIDILAIITFATKLQHCGWNVSSLRRQRWWSSARQTRKRITRPLWNSEPFENELLQIVVGLLATCSVRFEDHASNAIDSFVDLLHSRMVLDVQVLYLAEVLQVQIIHFPLGMNPGTPVSTTESLRV
jgi:hypothetical protein